MQYRVDPKSGNRISALGLGCMRFPVRRDARMRRPPTLSSPVRWSRGLTTWTRPISIPATRRAWVRRLSAWACATVLLATKLPHASCKCAEDFDRFFDEQLRRLRTDHIDYYLMHNITSPAQWERVVRWASRTGSRVKRRRGAFARLVFRTTAAQRTF